MGARAEPGWVGEGQGGGSMRGVAWHGQGVERGAGALLLPHMICYCHACSATAMHAPASAIHLLPACLPGYCQCMSSTCSLPACLPASVCHPPAACLPARLPCYCQRRPSMFTPCHCLPACYCHQRTCMPCNPHAMLLPCLHATSVAVGHQPARPASGRPPRPARLRPWLAASLHAGLPGHTTPTGLEGGAGHTPRQWAVSAGHAVGQ